MWNKLERTLTEGWLLENEQRVKGNESGLDADFGWSIE